MMHLFEHARDRLAEAIRRVRPVHLALAGFGLVTLLTAIEVELVPVFVFLGIVIALVLLWGREFLLLMQAPDDAFPGRFDKVIWALAILLVPPVGAPSFWVFRRAHWAEGGVLANPRPKTWLHGGF